MLTWKLEGKAWVHILSLSLFYMSVNSKLDCIFCTDDATRQQLA